jgi:hypothetical protein
MPRSSSSVPAAAERISGERREFLMPDCLSYVIAGFSNRVETTPLGGYGLPKPRG